MFVVCNIHLYFTIKWQQKYKKNVRTLLYQSINQSGIFKWLNEVVRTISESTAEIIMSTKVNFNVHEIACE